MYKNFNKYEVFEDGRIWSKVRNKFLKPYTRKDGYQIVVLSDNDGKLHYERLHKVVFFAVNGLWEYPEGMELNHLDEDKTNCANSNLSLVSRKQNNNWGTRTERAAKAMTNHTKMSKRVGAFKDDELVIVFPSTMEARRNGFHQGAVAACCRGERKTHKSFEWRYLDDDN